MSGIARVLAERGLGVTGSDRVASEVTESLEASGITVHLGHDSAHLGSASTVVVSSAVREENPELVEARARGLQVLHRSEALRWIIRGKSVIAIAGSHGKTTSTAMAATALERSGRRVGAVNGGVISEWGVSSRWGEDDLFVIEADESDRSFVGYHPSIIMITNIAPDHLDFYGTLEAIYEAFEEFAHTARDAVVLCADDEGTRHLAGRLESAALVMTYGIHPAADVVMTDLVAGPQARFTVSYRGENARCELGVPGRLNALNAAGVIATLIAAGFSLADAAAAASGFRGAERRFQFHGEISGVRFFDDHAHHPTEVAAALETARAVVGQGQVITMFQPHLYSRTQYMAGELAAAFSQGSDHTIFLDIFGSREDPIEGVTTALILEKMSSETSWEFEPDWAKACVLAVSRAKPGDIIVTMSTGDLYQIVPQLLEAKREWDRSEHG
jgi:UDP-N-acetylmuramate--alanine ligase